MRRAFNRSVDRFRFNYFVAKTNVCSVCVCVWDQRHASRVSWMDLWWLVYRSALITHGMKSDSWFAVYGWLGDTKNVVGYIYALWCGANKVIDERWDFINNFFFFLILIYRYQCYRKYLKLKISKQIDFFTTKSLRTWKEKEKKMY